MKRAGARVRCCLQQEDTAGRALANISFYHFRDTIEKMVLHYFEHPTKDDPKGSVG